MSCPPASTVHVVVTDANILINLVHVGRLDLLGKLLRYSFVVPEQVIAEVKDPPQSVVLAKALDEGLLTAEKLTQIAELELYAELLMKLGSGEAACLALAQSRGWLIASDERRVFFREVVRRLGPGSILNTAGLFVLAIHSGAITVDEADDAKALLERHRFRMRFASFRDVLP